MSKPHSERPVAESAKMLRLGGCGGGNRPGQGQAASSSLCLSFWIYKMGLKSPSMQTWQEDYRTESLSRALQAFVRGALDGTPHKTLGSKLP